MDGLERGNAGGLVQSRLPYEYWPYSARHYLHNAARIDGCDEEGARSPYERYYKRPFLGEPIPF